MANVKLAQFIRDRIAEEEFAAHRALSTSDVAFWQGRHERNWSPDKVLAHSDASRRVLHMAAVSRRPWRKKEVLRALAVAYKDHKDYKPKWAPRRGMYA